MKKILFILLIMILLLTACSDKNKNNEEDELLEDEILIPEDPIEEEEPVEAESIPEVIPDPEPEPTVEKFDVSDLVIEKNIGEYKFRDSKLVQKKFLDYDFDAYEAHYEFGTLKSVVSVLVPVQTSNLKLVLESLEDDDSFELLEAKEFDMFDYDIFYNPYTNIYTWVSEGKLITVEYSIGFDLVTKYLKEYPTAEVDGFYYDEMVVLEFDSENLIQTIFYNDNSYTFEISSYDNNDNMVELELNGIKKEFLLSEDAVFEGLWIELDSVNFDNQEFEFKIHKEVTELKTKMLSNTNSWIFTLNDKSHTLIMTGVDFDESEVTLSIDGKEFTYEEKDMRGTNGIKVALVDLLISNIGEDKAEATFEVWQD